jgi:hypothetical protein
MPPDRLSLAMRLFDQLDASDPGAGDLLFNIFGSGNTPGQPDRPFERFCWYEELLRALQRHNPSKYGSMHKGTAFFFLSWLSFDLKNYETALFYMDAAISEDFRRAPTVWLTEPAGRFLTLSDPANQVGGHHIVRIRELLDAQVARFNSASGGTLTLDGVINRFVTKFVQEPKHRTIVSAWYVHLLECEERLEELDLRSTAGGSIAPFIAHLFRGGLLLESVLKIVYPKSAGTTLGAVFKDSGFRADFGSGFATSATKLDDILKAMGGTFVSDAFSTSAKLRNTTGHNLVWDDAFASPAVFRRLYEQEMNAMLLVIEKKF